jgi:hypothetical protein
MRTTRTSIPEALDENWSSPSTASSEGHLAIIAANKQASRPFFPKHGKNRNKKAARRRYNHSLCQLSALSLALMKWMQLAFPKELPVELRGDIKTHLQGSATYNAWKAASFHARHFKKITRVLHI